ncbi:hypothetical protein [Massilia sp. Mn16-1_5]|uniref:hypothetical protein n=1 Tax=Massilia sp. Mn16-1_5 TaxID=2079199 RepID=UPI00109EA179|nr:hypothetical protein [Massilia sp. Mn16-1_5]THC44331.1 hypothetical protein C2862_10715 [Massilia sp. Mn16-1_5]
MSKIVLRATERSALERALDHCRQWAARHQAEVGVAEMALGAAIVSWGVTSGQIVLGRDVAGSRLRDIGGLAGLGVGASASAALAMTLLKGVFVGGVGMVAGVTCVPAAVIIGGGAAILGSFGYVLGDQLDALLEVSGGFGDLLLDGAAVAVGVALIIDGARRVVNDERVLSSASRFREGVISLVPQASEAVAATWDDLQAFVKEAADSPSAYAASGASALAGAAIGSSIAAGSVTVLGSSGLGAAALSLGLVSAPVWPIVACGAAGLALGLAAWKGVHHLRDRDNSPTPATDEPPHV